jgi:23S rRNA (adenine2503-C2)-methyltransferase
LPLPGATDAIELKNHTVEELEEVVLRLGEPRYRAKQIFSWLHSRRVHSVQAMTDLPVAFRNRLETQTRLGSLRQVSQQVSVDGTVKAAFELENGRQIESVLIPDSDDDEPERLTLCVSSQVGCGMACTFCATGTMGFIQNLNAGQIVDQFHEMSRVAVDSFGRGISNVVYMGMGEPLMNYENVIRSLRILTHELGPNLSPKRITVSTVGLAGRIRRLAMDRIPVKLAISLHAPTEEKRSAIMPVNRSTQTSLAALEHAVRAYYRTLKRPVTYEYCMLAGINDSESDAEELARVVRWIPSKVNLILYNAVPGIPYTRSSPEVVDRFVRALVARRITVTVRRSRGDDIAAACGQLIRENAATLSESR